MRPGREIDTRIAKEVFGHEVFVKQKALHERTPKGDRPLRNYSKEIEWAWEVARRLNMAVIPIEGGNWFAMVGKEEPWKSPQEFIDFMQGQNFTDSGAAIGDDVPLTICLAALQALENKKAHDASQAAPDNEDVVSVTKIH